MGNACASTTLQGPTASTVPRSTTTSLGRLPMARPEPPGSVSVSSQSGMASPDPLPEGNASSTRAFLPCVREAAHPEVVGRCFPSSPVSEEALPHPCQYPPHLCGQDSPVCTAPHLACHETAMSVSLAFLWDPNASPGEKVCCCGQSAAYQGTLEMTKGQICPLHGDHTLAGYMTFCCWMWALLTPGH